MKRDKTPFPGLVMVPPPSELKKRTLDQARAAMNHPPLPDVWTRIWCGRGFRLAWAGTAVALLAGHLTMTVIGHDQTSGDAPPPTIANTAINSELAEIVELPRITALLPGIQMVDPDSTNNRQQSKNAITKETPS